MGQWECQDTIKTTAGPGPDVGTPHSPQDKPEGCNGCNGPQETFQ